MKEADFVEGMEQAKKGSQESTAKWRICPCTCGGGEEGAREGFNGMATEEAVNEGVSDMWEERGVEQQLTEASFAEIA